VVQPLLGRHLHDAQKQGGIEGQLIAPGLIGIW
jgi:hypothetical protein